MDLSQLTPEQIAQLRAAVLGNLMPDTRALLLGHPTIPPGAEAGPAGPEAQVDQPLPPASTQAASLLPAPPSNTPVQQSAPVTEPYTSARPAQVPNRATFQPFLGAGRLSVGFDTRHANQARVASASRNLPRPPRLPAQTSNRAASSSRRGRGPASQPPTLNAPPDIRSNINSCRYTEGGRNMVRVTIKVYPTHENTGHQFILYRFYQQTVNNWLKERYLHMELVLEDSTTISALMNTILARLQQCPSHYQFRPAVSRAGLQLCLLSLVNRGQDTGSGNVVRLKPHAGGSGLTLSGLLSDRLNFVGAKSVCFEQERFVIYFAANSPSYSTGPNSRSNFNKLGKAFEQAFPHDNCFTPLTPSTQGDSSDGSDGEDTEVDEVASRIPAGAPLARLGSFAPPPYLPHEIWTNTFTPDPVPTRYTLHSLSEFAEEVCAEASNATTSLVVRGINMDAMVRNLNQYLDDAVERRDYARLLSSTRRFERLADDRFVVSFGVGLEREVIFTAFKEYQGSSFFLAREDGYSALQVAYPLAAPDRVPASRMRSLEKLGALCALMMLTGQCPSPFDPLLFHYIVHSCQLECLMRPLVGEWHPQLQALLSQWLEMGPTGDLEPFRAHFANLWDAEVSNYRDRDAASHKQLASEMLYRALFGPTPPTHQENKAFIRGFSLPCPQRNFTFVKALKEIEGGSESFLNLVWASQVGPERLMSSIDLTSYTPFREALSRYGVTDTPKALFENFIGGNGIPDQGALSDIQETLSPLVDLSQASSPNWRTRMFTLASTGHPFLEEGSDRISIQFSEDNHPSTTLSHRPAFSSGTVTFRTCIRSVNLPTSHVLAMAQDHQSRGIGPFQAVFDQWLLTQVLTGIGGHSIP